MNRHRLKRQRGSVFVVTLGVLAALVALVAALASTHKAATHSERSRMEERRARLMAEAGVQRAVAALQEQSPDRAYAGDDWARLGDTGGTDFVVGYDTFRLQIFDASSKVDLNTATEDELKHLPMTQEQIDSLLDWRDATPTSAATPRPQGAKDTFYNGLHNPYNAKLNPLDGVDELLQVKGFNYDTIYTLNRRSQTMPLATGATSQMPALSEIVAVGTLSADKDIAGKPKLDINAATSDQLTAIGIPKGLAQAIIQAKGSGFKKLEDVLKVQQMTKAAAQAIADNVTIGKDAQHSGLINVNTASEAVLGSITGMKPEVASAIVGRQSTGFKSLGELLDVPGIDVPGLAAVIDRLCVGSRTFIVRVVGIAAKVRVAAEATLTIGDDGQVRVTSFRPQPYWSVRERWGWPDQPTDRVVLGTTS